MTFPITGTFTVGTQPVALAASDFNGDGKIDLAALNSVDHNLTVLLGDGTGSFTTDATYATGAGTYVVTDDVNGDGDPDLVVSNFNDANLDILLGGAGATFASAPASPLSPGTRPLAIATGDFNGDGRADLAIGVPTFQAISIQLGDGAGGFSPTPGSPFPSGMVPTAAAVGDLNGDGKLDLVVANMGSDAVAAFLGDGAGGLATAVTYATAHSPDHVALSDLDGDGKLDLIVSTKAGLTIEVRLGDGSGGFGPAATTSVAAAPTSLAVGDLNGDSRPDVVIGSSNEVAIYFGDGTGGFAAPVTTSGVSNPTSLVIADFNGDGRPDIAATQLLSKSVSILTDTGLAIAASTPSKAEGGAGAQTSYSFTVTRYGSLSGAASVDWSVAGSGAAPAAAGDFLNAVLPSGTLNFADGEASKVITVVVAGDTGVEADETFTVDLSNPANIDIGVGAATGAVINDDVLPPPPPPPPTPSAGSNEADLAVLDAGGTTYAAGAGDDVVYGLGGDDTLHGNAGADELVGGLGNDLLIGGRDNDRLTGEAGDDRLYGDLGDDRLDGGAGRDVLTGGAGADILAGGTGADTLAGGDGADVLRGGQDDDLLTGDDGDDWLSGDRGDDILTGGAGADTFHIFAGAGADRVTDFSALQGDRVIVDGAAAWTVSQHGADTVVSLADGTTLTLAGITAASLPAGWIVGG